MDDHRILNELLSVDVPSSNKAHKLTPSQNSETSQLSQLSQKLITEDHNQLFSPEFYLNSTLTSPVVNTPQFVITAHDGNMSSFEQQYQEWPTDSVLLSQQHRRASSASNYSSTSQQELNSMFNANLGSFGNDNYDLSSSSFTSDMINHDYGMVSASTMPDGSRIIMVPTPYIQTIHSPATTPVMSPWNSPAHSPMLTSPPPFIDAQGYLQPQAQQFNNFFQSALTPPTKEVPHISFDEFLQQYQGNNSDHSRNPSSTEDDAGISSSENAGGDTGIPGVYTTVPTGKFWNTVKTGETTACRLA
jgi:hypothetical protein